VSPKSTGDQTALTAIERHDTVVIGGGQAGLAISRYLSDQKRDHVVLERARVAERWRSERWDSMYFQFPNWALRLPGFRHGGDDPEGFSHSRDVVRYIEDYARAIAAPLRTGMAVRSLERDSERFRIATADATFESSRVVIATGPFQRPFVPPFASALPAHIHQVTANDYRNPNELPPGAVLIVGSGASGAQIAEELYQRGRKVFLAVNRHRRVPRRYRGRDCLTWLLEFGAYETKVEDLRGGMTDPTILVTGVNGGHDIDLRRFARDGVVLIGRMTGVADGAAHFAGDVEPHLAEADRYCAEFKRRVDDHIRDKGLSAPEDDSAAAAGSTPVHAPQRLDLKAEGITSVIWCTGYRSDFGWVHLPIFDARGAPLQKRGVTPCPGAYFLGLHWMHKFKSAAMFGIEEDAEYLARQIAGTR
jgi:putative flavoprotein involved in K+ transport